MSTADAVHAAAGECMLSVVICHGSDHDLLPTIASVMREWDPLRHELIVARSASLPAVPLPAEIRTVVVASNRATVIRNRGAWHAKGRYLLFLDNDVTLAPGWRASIGALMAAECPAAHGTLVVDGGWVTHAPNESGLFLARVVWEREPFDERLGPGALFGSSEAHDLAVRAERVLGAPLVHAAYEVHHPPVPLPMSPTKTLSYALGNGYVYAKHRRARQAAWAVTKSLLRALVSRGAPRRAAWIRAAALVAGYGAYARNAEAQSGRHP